MFNSDSFLAGTGMANGDSVFIQPYRIQDEVAHEKRTRALEQRLKAEGREVAVLNLLEVVREVLQVDDKLKWLLDTEPQKDKDELKEDLEDWLDIDEYLTPAFIERLNTQNWDIAFFLGCGSIFPFLKTHLILDSMGEVADQKPVVFFYPGDYLHRDATGSELKLFGRRAHTGYYRAFNLDDYHL